MTKVFVNGSFDVLHRGHLELLNYAKGLGDMLFVAIDSDRRIAEKKGADRPFNNELNRICLLKNSKAVDAVTIFDSDNELINIIKICEPDIMIVGSDWRGKPIIGSQYAKELVYSERTIDESTTKTIESYINRRQKRFDEYHYGTIDRLSPEAPVPVFTPKRIESKNGMAANVEENLKALGVEVISYFGATSVKARMIDDRSKQHILRIDNDVKSEPLDYKKTYFPTDVDGIIISDYNKGFVSYELIESLIDTGIPVFVDTKKTDLARFNDAIVKINSMEFANAKSLPMNLIVTMGKHGAMWDQRKYDAPEIEIADVCGAGDTFLASFVYRYLQTNNIDTSIAFAIKASAVTVQHIGVYAPTLEEIE